LIETKTKNLISGCNTSVIPTDGSVTSIGDRAFMECESLTEIAIPNSVTNIGSEAFSGCSKLTSVIIPSGVTELYGVFDGCTSLTNVILPNTITIIGSWTFGNCTSLTSIEIPSSVRSIGTYAFAYSKGLTNVTFKNPEGWFVATDSSVTSWTELSSAVLSDSKRAATYLRSTYYNREWKRV